MTDNEDTSQDPQADITGELEPVIDDPSPDLVGADNIPGRHRGGLTRVITQGLIAMGVLFILAANRLYLPMKMI